MSEFCETEHDGLWASLRCLLNH